MQLHHRQAVDRNGRVKEEVKEAGTLSEESSKIATVCFYVCNVDFFYLFYSCEHMTA